MKIKVDDKVIFELSEVQKKIIMNDIPSEIFQQDLERRLCYIIEHKLEKCLERLKREWMPKLNGKVSSIPLNGEEFASLIFSQSDYKNRSQREAEEKK